MTLLIKIRHRMRLIIILHLLEEILFTYNEIFILEYIYTTKIIYVIQVYVWN
jgi:hypothetical protein